MDKLIHQTGFRFDVRRVNDDAFADRADFLTLGFIVIAHTLCAFIWMDFKNLFTHKNGLIGAFGFAHFAIGAGVFDQQRHQNFSSNA
jgi:hypothetical protein